MCGIVYKHNFNGEPVNNDILQQFDEQRSRGTQGFGLFDGKHIKRSANEDSILKWLVKYDAPMIMFHHRFPTSTINVKRAAHPMSTGKHFGKTQYILVHNGVIHNASELYKKHALLDITYSTELEDGSFNDSESLLWDMALVLEGQQDEPTVQGRMAFIIMKKVNGKLTTMHFGRNGGSPLNIFRTKDSLALSSEGHGTSIAVDKLYEWEYATNLLSVSDMTFPSYSYVSERYIPKTNIPMSTPSVYNSNWGKPYHDDFDEYQSYDDYYESKYGYRREKSTAGDWLGKVSQKRFQKLLDKQNVIDINDKGVVQETVEEEMDEQTLEDLYFSLTAESSEIEAKALSYLSRFNGFFTEAYYALEQEYGENLAQHETTETIKKRLVIEGALEFINSDPEYTEDDSISSLFEGGNLCLI